MLFSIKLMEKERKQNFKKIRQLTAVAVAQRFQKTNFSK